MKTPLPKRRYECRAEKWDWRFRVVKKRDRRDFWISVDWIERAWVNEFCEIRERRGSVVVVEWEEWEGRRGNPDLLRLSNAFGRTKTNSRISNLEWSTLDSRSTLA